MQIIENKSYIDRVVSFASAKTYEIVRETHIHAHPVKRGFPLDISKYLMVRGIGGISHELFEVVTVYEFNPNSIQELSEISDKNHRNSIEEYIKRRNENFGFESAPQLYRFYVLNLIRVFDPIFILVPNLQGYKYYSLDEI